MLSRRSAIGSKDLGKDQWTLAFLEISPCILCLFYDQKTIRSLWVSIEQA